MEQKLQPFNHPVFVDSGAHGLYSQYVRGKTTAHGRMRDEAYVWFTTKDFYKYVDDYAEFLHTHKDTIHMYVNVDVIFNPKLTWDIQLYMENTHNLRPLPIVHYGTDVRWLGRYMRRGYDYVGIGGLGQGITKESYMKWADEVFAFICDQPSRLPKVKTHGFAMTAHKLMVRYPWFSVDSTSWLKYGSYGQVIYPKQRNGKWTYTEPFTIQRVSMQASSGFNKKSAAHDSDAIIRKQFLQYIEEKGFAVGKSVFEKGEEIIIEPGLCNDDKMRCDLNAIYFIDLAKEMPEWPWAFQTTGKQQTL